MEQQRLCAGGVTAPGELPWLQGRDICTKVSHIKVVYRESFEARKPLQSCEIVWKAPEQPSRGTCLHALCLVYCSPIELKMSEALPPSPWRCGVSMQVEHTCVVGIMRHRANPVAQHFISCV